MNKKYLSYSSRFLSSRSWHECLFKGKHLTLFTLLMFFVLVSANATAIESVTYAEAVHVYQQDDNSLPNLHRYASEHYPTHYYAQKKYAQRDNQESQRNQERDEERSYGERVNKSDIVRQVKNRFDAEVLRISLNQQGTAYRVRVLMPNGRVRVVTIDAYR